MKNPQGVLHGNKLVIFQGPPDLRHAHQKDVDLTQNQETMAINLIAIGY